MGVEQSGFFDQVAVGFLQMLGNPFRLGKKSLHFPVKDCFQVHHGNLVAALAADIFRAAGAHIHFCATGAMSQAAEKMNG
jgi:hypothetical protein